MADILILGGGAAGMMAAISAAEQAPGADICIVEQYLRPGKKLLATGNGRCNLTNTRVSDLNYTAGDPAALHLLLHHVNELGLRDFFEAHLLHTVEKSEGRVYPYSAQAGDVLNVLLYWLRRLCVRLECGCTVTGLSRQGGGFSAALSDGRTLHAKQVVLALGGKAAPSLGGSGDGYSLAQSFGHTLAPLYPCLVPLRLADASPLKGLSGVRAACRVTLLAPRPVAAETGELQFTDYGISGICVMNLSNFLVPGRLPCKGGVSVSIDLFPDTEKAALLQLLALRRGTLAGETVDELFTGLLNKKLGQAVWRTLRIGSFARTIGSLSDAELELLAAALKGWRLSGLFAKEYPAAQTTGGGVRLSEIDPASCESRLCPGLYLAGEVLDCAGACGGFNLHWAFGTGRLAGACAAEHLK